MIYLAMKRMLKRRIKTLFLFLALLCIFVLIPFGFKLSKDVGTTVEETIAEHGRGSYDLLVRPSSSRTEIEKELGMVEENYIGDAPGGISINEWKELDNNPDIEIAAPIAFMGYFLGEQTSIKLPVLDEPTKFTYEYYTTDGINKYPIGEGDQVYYFQQEPDGLIQYIGALSKTSHQGAVMFIYLPKTYQSVAAIDIENESRLTGIDYSELENKVDRTDFVLEGLLETFGDPPVVKVVQRKDLTIPLFIKLRLDTLDVKLDDYLKKLGISDDTWIMDVGAGVTFESLREISSLLDNEPKLDTKNIELDLTQFMNPFNGKASMITKDLKIKQSNGSATHLDTSTYYTADPIHYTDLDSIPKVQIIKEGNPPAYKEVHKKGVSMDESFDIPFILHQVGTFAPMEEPQSELAASPLAIYGETATKTIDGDTLTPTTKPGSFITPPVSGVTILENAELVKGDKPIDAIRVKVAGIASYDEVGRGKIEQVATQLLKQGYEVDVVAGSSFHKMTLDVEGIGKVIEPWTTLGAAQELVTTWDSVTLLSTSLFIIFSLLWLSIRMTLEKNVLAQENALLSLIGWRESRINLRNFAEKFFVITSAFVVSLIVLSLLGAANGMFVITGILWLFTLLAAGYLLYKKERSKSRPHAYKRFASLFYYKGIILPVMVILLLSTVLIAIQSASLGYTYTKSGFTSLGQYTNDITVWIQLLILAFTILLTIISVSESLSMLLAERRAEFKMYHTIGWRRWRIRLHLIKEVVIWSMTSVIFGMVVGGTVLRSLGISTNWSMIGLGFAFILVVFLVAMATLTKRLFHAG